MLFCTGGVGSVGTAGALAGGIIRGGGAGVLSLSRRLSGLVVDIIIGASSGLSTGEVFTGDSAGVGTGAKGSSLT